MKRYPPVKDLRAMVLLTAASEMSKKSKAFTSKRRLDQANQHLETCLQKLKSPVQPDQFAETENWHGWLRRQKNHLERAKTECSVAFQSDASAAGKASAEHEVFKKLLRDAEVKRRKETGSRSD